MSKDTTTHQCSRIPRPHPSHIAGTAVLYHQRTLGHAPHRGQSTHSGLGCSNAKRAALGLQPRQHGPHGTRTAASTHCTVSCIGCAATPQCGTVRACGGVECRHKGLPAHPALPRCNQRIWTHLPCGVVQGLWRRWSGGPGWSACVRPLRGAPPGPQLGTVSAVDLAPPVMGRRTATTLRARGPPRAPRMHLDSCYMAEAGGAVHHGTLPHHGPRNPLKRIAPDYAGAILFRTTWHFDGAYPFCAICVRLFPACLSCTVA
jgi:hypothetical protein